MKFLSIALLSTFFPIVSRLAAEEILSKEAPIAIPNSHGGFDFIEVDQANSRLLLPHSGNGTLDIVDLVSSGFIKSVPTGVAQDVSVDDKGGRYFVSISKETKLVTVDSSTLKINGEIPLSGPADIVAFDSQNGVAYVGHDNAAEVWAVDVNTKKVVAGITIPEGPEGIAVDGESHRIYVNAKSADAVVVIDPASKTTVGTWPTAPALKPHGSALDSKGHRLFVAGGNGKLVAMDLNSGKVVSSVDIAPRVDQIAYDSGLNRIYCASGTGVLSVVDAKAELKFLGNVTTQKGVHSVAVDQKSHAVWIAYSGGKDAPGFIQKMK